MIELSAKVMFFLEKQGFVIVSTIDENGGIHCSAKGIAGMDKEGKVYLIDLYRMSTFRNLQNNPTISITAVDEHRFTGYTLKGKAHMVERENIKEHIMQNWEEKIVKRISRRVVKNIQGEKGSVDHPEAHFPQPQYLIVMEVEGIIDLAPAPLKNQPV